MYEVTIGDVPDIRLTGFEHRGPYHAIGATFDRLVGWAAPRGLLNSGARCFGVYFDNPRLVAPQELRAFAGLALPDTTAAEGADIIDLAGGACAVFVHTGDYKDLERAYTWLYDVWFPASGRRPDPDRPCREEYLNDPRAFPPAEWLTRIAAPLR